MRTIGLATFLLFMLASACTKEALEIDAQGITDYRTYDWVPVNVKDAGSDGFALLCKNTQFERRTGFLRSLGADGSTGTAIDQNTLPTIIENVDFSRDELLYTDFARRQDGTYFLVGTGRETGPESRLHLVVQHMDKYGAQMDEPFRRFITSDAVVNTNVEHDLLQDLNGLPRQRALCDVMDNGDLIAAVRWETAASAGVRLFRFPASPEHGPTVWTDIALDHPTDRLHQMACDPSNGRTILVTDADDSGVRKVEVFGFIPEVTAWSVDGSSHLPGARTEPERLTFEEGMFVLVGDQPRSIVRPSDGSDPIDPFLCRFTSASDVASGFSLVEGTISDGRSVASYCAGWWDGTAHLLLQTHEVSALPPFFDGDITSDLSIVDMDAGMNASEPETIITGQGLRAIGAFKKGGKRIVVGSQHPFLNAGYTHTFYIVLGE